MNSKREECAIDALFVSQLRSNHTEANSLPELNEAELSELDSVGDGYVERLLAGEVEGVPDDNNEVRHEGLLCGPAFGLNRAEGIDDATKLELDQKRREIIERLKKQDGGEEDANAGK